MTLTFPLTNIMSLVDYSADTQPPVIVPRQEFSRLSSGATRGKDLGPALWSFDFTTKPLPNDEALEFEALLDTLDGVIRTFEACDQRRLAPRAYPTGACNDGVIQSVNANNRALALSGLMPGQKISAGDYLSFTFAGNRAFHRAAESVIANGSGVTPQFELRPHVRPGWTISPSTPVNLRAPRAICTLVPGSYSPRASGALHTVISFRAMQFLQ